MRKVTRSMSVAALAVCLGAASLAAQGPVQGDFQWYIGGQAGVLVFRTPAQTRGGMFMAGGHTLITARRTGLLLSVDEGIGSNEQSAYTDATGTSQTVVLVEVKPELAVPWTAPMDYAFDPTAPAKGLRIAPNGKWLVAFGDGSAQELPGSLQPLQLIALFTKAKGDIVDWDR